MTSRTSQRRSRTGKGASGKTPAARGKAAPSRRGKSSSRRNATVAIGIVFLVAAVIIGVGVLRKPAAAPVTSGGDAAEAIGLVTSVPTSALDGASVVSGITPPAKLASGVPALTQDGKPQVLYVGAEYCPYCAAQRWPLIVALSRFGTFSGLGVTTSSATDAFPNTPSFTFHGSSYTSPYLVFTPVEQATNTGVSLDTLTPEQQALLQKYDAPPYTSSAGAIPFLMIGNRYIQIGASYLPDALAGKTQAEIARELADPSANPAAQKILGSANVLTAAICQLTGGTPSSVCQSPGVTRAAQALPTQPPN